MSPDQYIFTERTGYTTPTGGYSGSFSWWRNTFRPWLWTVQGCGQFCASGLAVTDDFGSLVQVQS